MEPVLSLHHLEYSSDWLAQNSTKFIQVLLLCVIGPTDRSSECNLKVENAIPRDRTEDGSKSSEQLRSFRASEKRTHSPYAWACLHGHRDKMSRDRVGVVVAMTRLRIRTSELMAFKSHHSTECVQRMGNVFFLSRFSLFDCISSAVALYCWWAACVRCATCSW